MQRSGHNEDMLWRGCLIASETEHYLSRYTKANSLFRTKKPTLTDSCLDCHDGKHAQQFSDMWRLFPRFNPKKNRLEDFAQAIQDEIELRYGGTRPVRTDSAITALYIYALTKAKQKKVQFQVEKESDSPLTKQQLAALRPTKECNEIFQAKGTPKGTNAPFVVKGCNEITDTGRYVSPLLQPWRSEMKCNACHRNAGNQRYAGNLGHSAVLLPIMMTRRNKPTRFYRRILMCYARSINWFDLGTDSPVLPYIRLYANWLAQKDQLQIGKIYPGRGIPRLYDTLGRGSSIMAGEKVYKTICIGCHGKNGWGGVVSIFKGLAPPPITGLYAYNNAAGLAQPERLAGFIYYNMPPGASHKMHVLTKQQALDVAAYLKAQGRPSDFTRDNQIMIFMKYLWQRFLYDMVGAGT
jgi:cytochrome c